MLPKKTPCLPSMLAPISAPPRAPISIPVMPAYKAREVFPGGVFRFFLVTNFSLPGLRGFPAFGHNINHIRSVTHRDLLKKMNGDIFSLSNEFEPSKEGEELW
jgi:hypothetical protein